MVVQGWLELVVILANSRSGLGLSCSRRGWELASSLQV